MQPADDKGFDQILGELFAALDKPLTETKRAAFWKGLGKMSLLEFARCRDVLLASLEDGQPRKTFSVSDVWAARSKLRAEAPVEPTDDGWRGDKWDAAANRHLLAHVGEKLRANSRQYGKPPTYWAMRLTKRETHPNADASPEFIAHVAKLVEAKKAWAVDMRDITTPEGVPIELQKKIWEDYLTRAEADIARCAGNPTS